MLALKRFLYDWFLEGPFGTFDAFLIALNVIGLFGIGILLFRFLGKKEIEWRFWQDSRRTLILAVGLSIVGVGVLNAYIRSPAVCLCLSAADFLVLAVALVHWLLVCKARTWNIAWLPWITGITLVFVLIVVAAGGGWAAYRVAWDCVPRHLYEKVFEEAPSPDIHDLKTWNGDSYWCVWAGCMQFRASRETFERLRSKEGLKNLVKMRWEDVERNPMEGYVTSWKAGGAIRTGGPLVTIPKWWKGFEGDGVEIWYHRPWMGQSRDASECLIYYDPASMRVGVLWFEIY